MSNPESPTSQQDPGDQSDKQEFELTQEAGRALRIIQGLVFREGEKIVAKHASWDPNRLILVAADPDKVGDFEMMEEDLEEMFDQSFLREVFTSAELGNSNPDDATLSAEFGKAIDTKYFDFVVPNGEKVRTHLQIAVPTIPPISGKRELAHMIISFLRENQADMDFYLQFRAIQEPGKPPKTVFDGWASVSSQSDDASGSGAEIEILKSTLEYFGLYNAAAAANQNQQNLFGTMHLNIDPRAIDFTKLGMGIHELSERAKEETEK